jgi:PAS domain S-box-containing protein
MTYKKAGSNKSAEMRRRAEKIVREKAARSPENQPVSPAEIQRTLQELHVHQIELKMQNEELRRTQVELEAARERYFDLFELAPVGYCLLSEKGQITEANLTTISMLGVVKNVLLNRPISRFIAKEDHDIYYLFRKKLFENGEPQKCDLRMLKKDGALFWAHLESNAARNADGSPVCRISLSDITERKNLEEKLTLSKTKLQERIKNRTSDLQIANDILNNEIFARRQAENHLAEKLKELHALSQQIINAHESERRTVALELHDEIGQSVTALKILITQAERLPRDKGQNSLKEAGIIAGELLQRLREMSLKLRPSMLDDLGLLPALIWHFKKFTAQTGIRVNFDHNGLPEVLPPEINITAYRIIQEALTNVARYAEIDEVNVNISFEKDLLSIRIEDKGRGFTLSEINTQATAGLSGMRERVLLLGGNLVLDTAPRQGTRIMVDLPVGDQNNTA